MNKFSIFLILILNLILNSCQSKKEKILVYSNAITTQGNIINKKDKNTYFKTILQNLFPKLITITNLDMDTFKFIELLESNYRKVNLDFSKDLYLIKSYQYLNLNINNFEIHPNKKIDFKNLNDYLFEKYALNNKSPDEIITIFAAAFLNVNDESRVFGLVKNVLSNDEYKINENLNGEEYFLLLQAITFITNLDRDSFNFNHSEQLNFSNNLILFLNTILGHLSDLSDEGRVLNSLKTIDSILNYFEKILFNQLSFDKPFLVEYLDEFWINDFLKLKNQLLENYKSLRLSQVYLNFLPQSNFLKAIVIEIINNKKNIDTNVLYNFDFVHSLISNNIDNFKQYNSENHQELIKNYGKLMSYSILLQAKLDYLIQCNQETVKDFIQKINFLREEIQFIANELAKSYTSEIKEYKDGIKFLTKGIYFENIYEEKFSLIVHPLAFIYPKKEFELHAKSISGGYIDNTNSDPAQISNKDFVGMHIQNSFGQWAAKNYFLGYLPIQTFSIVQFEHQNKCNDIDVAFGCNRYQNRFHLSAIVTPGKAPSKGIKGKSGEEGKKITVYINSILKKTNLILISNGANGGKGQNANPSPYCINGIYQIKRYTVGNADSTGTGTANKDYIVSLFGQNYIQEIQNGEPGDGGDGGKGGKIMIFSKNDNFEDVTALSLAGMPGLPGNSNNCRDSSGVDLQGNLGGSGENGNITKEKF